MPFQLLESFTSVQGESTHAGRPCFFLRFAGCNLKCSFCDTVYALDPAAGQPRELAELVGLAAASGVELVELTGGEPLLQPELPQLAEALLARGFTVLVETNGSVPIAPLPREVRKIVDCKPPSSGMAAHNLFSNYPGLAPHDEIKFLIGGRADFDYALDVIAVHRPERFTRNLIFSPVWGEVPFRQLAEWVVAARIPGSRMQLQMHKFIWPPDQRGV